MSLDFNIILEVALEFTLQIKLCLIWKKYKLFK